MVGGGWVGGLQHFSVSPRPLGFRFLGFGAKGLGQGLTIVFVEKSVQYQCMKV